VDNESFQKDFGHNLPESVVLHLQEEMKQQRTKPVSVGVWVSEVQYDRAQEMVLA
jgi:hypothetical protein